LQYGATRWIKENRWSRVAEWYPSLKLPFS
jgi:hypothetical protein